MLACDGQMTFALDYVTRQNCLFLNYGWDQKDVDVKGFGFFIFIKGIPTL